MYTSAVTAMVNREGTVASLPAGVVEIDEIHPGSPRSRVAADAIRTVSCRACGERLSEADDPVAALPRRLACPSPRAAVDVNDLPRSLGRGTPTATKVIVNGSTRRKVCQHGEEDPDKRGGIPGRVDRVLHVVSVALGALALSGSAVVVVLPLPQPAVGGTCGPGGGSEPAIAALVHPSSIGAGPERPRPLTPPHGRLSSGSARPRLTANGLAPRCSVVAGLHCSSSDPPFAEPWPRTSVRWSLRGRPLAGIPILRVPVTGAGGTARAGSRPRFPRCWVGHRMAPPRFSTKARCAIRKPTIRRRNQRLPVRSPTSNDAQPLVASEAPQQSPVLIRGLD